MLTKGFFRKAWVLISRRVRLADQQRPMSINERNHKSDEHEHILATDLGQNANLQMDNNSECFNKSQPGELISMAPDPYRPFADLPVEIVLNIVDTLSQEFRVLLSLTCKRLRSMLTSCMGLSVSDPIVRTNFLRYVERDHPEYLTCRSCGWMYMWRKRRNLSFTCPRSSSHPQWTDRAVRQTTVCYEHSVFLNHEVRELILRANSIGSEHGLPITYLNTNCIADDQVSCRATARLVHGQLILAMRWVMQLGPNINLQKNLYALDQAMCSHRWHFKSSFYSDIISRDLPRHRSDGPATAKCPYCATDYKALITDLEGGRVQISLEVWQNFGGGRTDSIEIQQIFHAERPSKLVRIVSSSQPASRDVEALFRSEEGDPGFVEVCESDHGGPEDPVVFDGWIPR